MLNHKGKGHNELFENVKNKLNYFGDETNLHGVRHIFSRTHIPSYKRYFWIVIVSVCCLGASTILRPLLTLYSGEAVSYLMDTNYIHFETPFPAVTLCEQTDSGRVKEFLALNGLPKTLSSFYKDVSFWNLKYCKQWCNTCKINVTCMENFTDAVEAIRAPCTRLLTDCWFDGKYFPCCERFHPIETEYGVCFVFNSRLTGNVTMLSVNQRSNLPSLVFSAKDEIGIRVHSPDDMVSVGMENVLGRPVALPLISDFEVILSAEQTTSDVSVAAMTPRARNCLYKHEIPSFAEYWNFQRYSYSTCILYCRAMAQLALCNCTHHLMPRIRNFTICGTQGIVCLGKNKDKFGTFNCDCPMSCEEVMYKLVHMFHSRKSGNLPEELVARGTRGVVRMAQLPTLRVRRVAIRHTLGLVVDIGGVLGVFFGASLLSIIEIIYLLCVRKGR